MGRLSHVTGGQKSSCMSTTNNAGRKELYSSEAAMLIEYDGNQSDFTSVHCACLCTPRNVRAFLDPRNWLTLVN